MPQSYSFDDVLHESTLSTKAGGSLRDQGPAWKLEGETLAKLDAIRDQLGVASLGARLSTRSLLPSGGSGARFTMVASDGDLRRKYSLNYASAQPEARSPGQAVERAIAAFAGREARAREGEVKRLHLETQGGRLVEESKVSAKLRMAGSVKWKKSR